MRLSSKALLLFVPLAAGHAACRSEPRLPAKFEEQTGGSGITAGAGSPTGGTGGVAGSPAGGTGGAPGGTGPTCSALATFTATVPYELSNEPEASPPLHDQAGAGGEGGEGNTGGTGGKSGAGGIGGDGGTASGCVRDGQNVTCSGPVRAREIDGAPAFVYDDGSTLTWRATPEGGELTPPEASAGRNLWIDYTEEYRSFCPFCGGYKPRTIAIRAAEEGELLYVGHEGPDDAFDLEALFGVAVSTELVCDSATYQFDCYDVVDHHYDMVLDTSPAERVPFGVVRRVDTPNGSFDAVWRTSEVTNTYRPQCYDGRTPLHSRDFAARRVGE